MATNLTPVDSYDDVPLIEVGDQVKGGLEGAANKQAIALANRTEHLKGMADKNQQAIANITPDSINAAKKTHTHKAVDITDLDPEVAVVVQSMIEAGTGVSINYNPTSNKLRLTLTDAAQSPTGFTANDATTTADNATVNYKINHQTAFNFDAYALRKVVNSAGSNLIDNYNSALKYNSTDQIVYNPQATLASPASINVAANGSLFSGVLSLQKGQKVNITNNLTGSIIPKMTANNAPSGYTAIASSNNSDSGAGSAIYKAFDKVNGAGTDAWTSNAAPSSGSPQWIGIQLPNAVAVNAYSIATRNQTNYSNSPKSWKFQGSNDGSAWTDLHSITGDTSNVPGQVRTYQLAGATAYKYYRVYITEANFGTLSSFVGVGELDIMTTKKMTIRNAGNYYVDDGAGALKQVTMPAAASDVETVGKSELNFSTSALSALTGTIEVVMGAAGTAKVINVPIPQIVLPKATTLINGFSNLQSASVVQSITGNAVVKYGVAIDNSGDYYRYNTTSAAWEKIGTLTNSDASAALLDQNGMTAAQLAAITATQWSALYVNGLTSFGIAFSISVTGLTDTAMVSSSSIVASSTYWEKCAEAEVRVRWYPDLVSFVVASKGDYKLCFQAP